MTSFSWAGPRLPAALTTDTNHWPLLAPRPPAGPARKAAFGGSAKGGKGGAGKGGAGKKPAAAEQVFGGLEMFMGGYGFGDVSP